VLFNLNLLLGDTMQDAVETENPPRRRPRCQHGSPAGLYVLHDGKDFFEIRPRSAAARNQGPTIPKALRRCTPPTARHCARFVLDPRGESLDLVGTPDSVARYMGEMMDEIGGDGFSSSASSSTAARSAKSPMGLAAALQRRGLIRPSYSHKHFRDNLLAYLTTSRGGRPAGLHQMVAHPAGGGETSLRSFCW